MEKAKPPKESYSNIRVELELYRLLDLYLWLDTLVLHWLEFGSPPKKPKQALDDAFKSCLGKEIYAAIKTHFI